VWYISSLVESTLDTEERLTRRVAEPRPKQRLGRYKARAGERALTRVMIVHVRAMLTLDIFSAECEALYDGCEDARTDHP